MVAVLDRSVMFDLVAVPATHDSISPYQNDSINTYQRKPILKQIIANVQQ
jgi:hypothetical protein